MKLIGFMCLFFVLAAAGTGFSQQKINMHLGKTSLKEALSELQRQTNVLVMYSDDDVEIQREVVADFKNVSLEEFFQTLLKGSRMAFRIAEDIVVIYPKETTSAAVPQAEQIRIKGVVRDATKTPIPGVTVMIKGTTYGVATDMDGRFDISAAKMENITLIFSFVGMKSKEVLYTGAPEMEVVMEEELAEVDEVVVTGYYTTNKSSYTGAARTITAEELRRGGNQNLLSMLRNVDPSFVQVADNLAGSNPNVVPEFQIRGTASIGGLRESYTGNPNMPVFIVDGFESTAEKVFDMDPHRVSSLTLLKDASATAIYGSRASNGVVVITTLTPKQGRVAVSYTADATFYAADLSDYNLCDATEKLEVEKLAGLYDVSKKSYYTQDPVSDQIQMNKAYNWRYENTLRGYNTYWLDKPLHSLTVAHKHALIVDGGSENLLYALNLNYNDTPGVMKESGRTRMGISLKLQYIHRNLTFKNELSFTNVKSTNSPYGEFSEYTRLNPYVRYKDEDGKYIYELEQDDRSKTSEHYIYNPLYNTTLNTIDKSKYNDVTNLFGIDWRVNDQLRLKGSFSFTVQNRSSDVFKPAGHTDFANYTGDDFLRRGSYVASRGEVFSYDGSIILTYFTHFNRHTFNANAGWNIRQSSTSEFSVKAEGFPNDNLDYISFATQYAKNDSPTGDEYTSRLVGFLGNINYSYDERFLVDLSLRGDASSQFGSDNRWAPFWSVGLGYNIHHESCMKELDWLQQFKIRGTYGLTGSQDYDPYQAMTTYKYLNTERYHQTIGTEVITMGNADLSWQRTFQWNFGTDITLWDNRIDLAFDYYIKTSKDVLTTVTLPPSLGFSSYMANLGEVENRGWEANLRAHIVRNKQLNWSVNFTAVHNKNKLLKISNALRAYNDSQDSLTTDGDKEKGANRPRVRYIEGASMNSIWVNHSLGIDPVTGMELFRANNGDIVSQWSSANYQIGGCTDSDLEGTFGTHFSWKGLQMSMIFQYRIGGQVYNQTLVDKVQDVDPRYNVDKRAYEDRWKQMGDKVRFTSFVVDDYNVVNTSQVTKPTSRFVEDYNYLSLATLNLSYDFNMTQLERLGIKRLRTFLYLNDLFHASNVKRERGIDYPFARNYSVGLQVSF